MTNQGKFLIFAGAIILLAMMAGGSNNRPTNATASYRETEIAKFRSSPEGKASAENLRKGLEKYSPTPTLNSPHSCFDPDYPNDPNCIWTDADKSAIGNFQRALTITQNRARTGKWIDAPK